MRGLTRRFKSAVVVATVLALTSPTVFAQDGDEELDFQPDEIKRVPPSKTLERAAKLYDKGDYYSASIEFKKVLAGETTDDESNKMRAEFFMGKTLYQMGYYAPSLAYFTRIVEAGETHRYYNATLKWLAALSRVLPETSGILEKIGNYDPKELEQPIMDDVRDELYYLLGRHFYRRGQEGDFETAISLFERVSDQNPFYVRAKFFEGVTHVRKYEGGPAVDAFKEILRIAQTKPKQYDRNEVEEFEELANLQMARVFYSTQQYDTSIRYYEKLPQSSIDWTNSLFEASWAYFMKTNNSKALGNIHTLNAPYFEEQFFPESILLKSVIYYKYCLYDRAMESVAEYDNVYRPLRKNLQDIVDKFEDNADFYGYIQKIFDGKAGLPAETQRLVLSVLGDRTLKKTFNWVDELTKEMKMHEKADPAWKTTAIANEVSSELELQRSLAQDESGQLARERIERLIDELRELNRDGIKIKIEVLNAKAGQITADAKDERITGDHKEEPIVIDDEHFMWKFNGEYWKDELGYYRFKIRSKCPKGAK